MSKPKSASFVAGRTVGIFAKDAAKTGVKILMVYVIMFALFVVIGTVLVTCIGP